MTRDILLMKLRGLALRMQGRVEVIEDRDGKDGAVTGNGIGISYLLARDLAKALSNAADFIDGPEYDENISLKTAAVTLRAFAGGDAVVPDNLRLVPFSAMHEIADWLWAPVGVKGHE